MHRSLVSPNTIININLKSISKILDFFLLFIPFTTESQTFIAIIQVLVSVLKMK